MSAPSAAGVTLPPRGSQLWVAEKLSRKQTALTYSLLSVAAGRLLWITQIQRRRLRGSMRVVAPQLVVWSIFWPTALVCLRAGIKWADTYVVKSGLGLPSEAAERREKPEVDGDERRDV